MPTAVATSLLIALLGCLGAPAGPEAGAVASGSLRETGQQPGGEALAAAPDLRWATVLRRLDARRGHAFGRGDPGGLRAVYAAGSSALRKDRSTLAAYRGRGLSLRLRMAVVTLRAVRQSRDGVVLDVVDRLVGAAAVDRDGRLVELPRDLPTARQITLVRTPDGWRIAAVRHSP